MQTEEQRQQMHASLVEQITASPTQYATVVMALSDQVTSLQKQVSELEAQVAQKPTEDVGFMQETLTNAEAELVETEEA